MNGAGAISVEVWWRGVPPTEEGVGLLRWGVVVSVGLIRGEHAG